MIFIRLPFFSVHQIGELYRHYLETRGVEVLYKDMSGVDLPSPPMPKELDPVTFFPLNMQDLKNEDKEKEDVNASAVSSSSVAFGSKSNESQIRNRKKGLNESSEPSKEVPKSIEVSRFVPVVSLEAKPPGVRVGTDKWWEDVRRGKIEMHELEDFQTRVLTNVSWIWNYILFADSAEVACSALIVDSYIRRRT
jgi:hypothetical protein